MMLPEDMAAIHARSFEGAPRPWSAEEFRQYLLDRNVLVHCERHGFGVVRVIAGEAELLTLAVDPDHRQAGVGRSILAALCRSAAERGAGDMLLEVAADNVAARSLYARAGFEQVGLRAAYYAGADALILRRAL